MLNRWLLLMLSGLMLYTTIVEQKYFSKPHITEFRALAVDAIKWDKQFGSNNICKTVNIHYPYYLNYYFDKFDYPMSFLLYKCEEIEALARLRTIVDTSSTKYFMYGWSSTVNSPRIESLIRRKYNVVKERDMFLNSGITLYCLGEPKPYFFTSNDFEKANKWPGDSIGRCQAIHHLGKYAFKYEKTQEFGPGFSLNLAALHSIKNATLQASVWIYTSKPDVNAGLVVNIEMKDQPAQWQCEDLKYCNASAFKWTRLFINVPLTPEQIQKGNVKVYVWNLNKQEFSIDDFEIKIVPN